MDVKINDSFGITTTGEMFNSELELTRNHSSRMRTARFSSSRGGLSNSHL